MAIGQFRTSHDDRVLLRRVAVVLLAASVVAAVCVVVHEVAVFRDHFSSGILDAFKTSMGVPLAHKSVAVATLTSLALLLVVAVLEVVRTSRTSLAATTLWSLLLLTSAFVVFFAAAIAVLFAQRFDGAVAATLIPRLANYSQDRRDREFVDGIQTTYACCGVVGVNDFLDLSEVHVDGYKNTLRPNTRIANCTSFACRVPLSCCKSSSCSRRVELLQTSSNSNDDGDDDDDDDDDDDVVASWYQPKGCIQGIDEPHIGLSVPQTWTIVALLYSLFGLQIIALFFTQLTLTSYASLNTAGLIDGDSYAWILPCAYPSPAQLVQRLENEALDESDEDESSPGAHSSGRPPRKSDEKIASASSNTTTKKQKPSPVRSDVVSSPEASRVPPKQKQQLQRASPIRNAKATKKQPTTSKNPAKVTSKPSKSSSSEEIVPKKPDNKQKKTAKSATKPRGGNPPKPKTTAKPKSKPKR